MALPRIHIDDTVLLVVDLQEKLLPVIEDHDRIVQRSCTLIAGCRALDVPVLATEQYPRGLGPTVGPVLEAMGPDVQVESKLRFSAFVEGIRAKLALTGRRTVLICGIETHVCVLQTALDLAEQGYVAMVVGDATGSRRAIDRDMGLARMSQAGIVPVSVEMVLLEMIGEAGTERFKMLLPIIK